MQKTLQEKSLQVKSLQVKLLEVKLQVILPQNNSRGLENTNETTLA